MQLRANSSRTQSLRPSARAVNAGQQSRALLGTRRRHLRHVIYLEQSLLALGLREERRVNDHKFKHVLRFTSIARHGLADLKLSSSSSPKVDLRCSSWSCRHSALQQGIASSSKLLDEHAVTGISSARVQARFMCLYSKLTSSPSLAEEKKGGRGPKTLPTKGTRACHLTTPALAQQSAPLQRLLSISSPTQTHLKQPKAPSRPCFFQRLFDEQNSNTRPTLCKTIISSVSRRLMQDAITNRTSLLPSNRPSPNKSLCRLKAQA
ncbi:hypothetical protein Bca101_025826 [Brassica carinata]